MDEFMKKDLLDTVINECKENLDDEEGLYKDVLTIIKLLQTERDELKSLITKIVLCFPETIPRDKNEVTFNIPPIIIEELRQAQKGK